jgi:LacI family transcriptional regulator, fructose operon transcriptional repressor
MASIKEVAAAAGVSTATVSRVLAEHPHVRAELRARVMEAIAQLNYRPNLVARSLRSQHSSAIGLIVSDIRNPFFTSVSRAVEDTAYAEGVSLILCNTDEDPAKCNTDEDPAKEAMYLSLMRDQNVGGIIFSPTRQTLASLGALQADFPIVLLDRAPRDGEVDAVLLDNLAAGYILTTHLVANGYRRIGALFGEASTTGRDRRRGHQDALEERGLNADLATYVAPRMEAGYAATLELLSADPRPDAILTSNSLLTAGALKAIRERELAIPHDVALAGFDDTDWAEFVEPGITVLAQPTDEIGRAATELLLRRIADPSRPTRKVILNGQLIVRGSSAPRR